MVNKINILSGVFYGLIFLILTAATPNNLSRANFSGTWLLNVTKSEFGQVPARAAVKKFEVEQKGDSVFIKRTTINANNKEVISSESISLDGENCNSILDDKRTRASIITWSEDERMMLTTSSYSAPGNASEIEYKIAQTWELINDGKQMTVVLATPGYSIRLMYDKQ